MAVHNAKMDATEITDGEVDTFWFVSCDSVDPDLFLPMNRPGLDEHEAEVAELFGTRRNEEGTLTFNMRLHRNYLVEKGAEFLTQEQVRMELSPQT